MSMTTTFHDFDLPSGRGFIALLEAFRETGGTALSKVVGRLLEQHQLDYRISLDRLICTGQVFGFKWRGGLWVPMFQFDPQDLSVKSSAQKVCTELSSLPSGWAVASWFAQPNERLNGRKPVDVLARDPQAVLWTARLHQSLMDHSFVPLQRGHEVVAHA